MPNQHTALFALLTFSVPAVALAGIRLGVGPLAHLLRNRFHIGEVVHRRAVHLGEQEPILDRTLFDAVQAKLAASANVASNKLSDQLSGQNS
jgi:hypothetical protein